MTRFLGIVYVLGVLVATLQPQPVEHVEQLTRCIICGRRGMADALLNIVLFVPFGALLVRRLRPVRTVLAAAIFSTAIEAAQLVIPGRDPSAGDILFNTLGAAIGALLVVRAGAWLAPRYRRHIAAGYAAALIAVFFLTGWLLSPRTPPGPYAAQIAPALERMDTFPGTVTAAAFGGRPLSAGPARGAEAWPVVLELGAPLGVAITTGAPTDGLAPLVVMTNPNGYQAALLGVDGGDVVYRRWTHASRLRFDAPAPRRYAGLDTVAPGTRVLINVRTNDAGTCIVVNHHPECGIGFDASDGWRLLRDIPGSDARAAAWLGAVWLVLLTLPLGYLGGWRVGTVLLVVLGWYAYIRLPVDTGMLPVAVTDLLALALGTAIGAAVAWRTGAPATEAPTADHPAGGHPA